MKSKLIVLSAVVLMFSAGQVFAGGGHDHGGHGEEAVAEKKGSMMDKNHSNAFNVGNKICPVSNELVGAMAKPYKVEHEGKVYNLCCKMCAKDFKKDPQKYIEKINEELEGSQHGDHEEKGHEDEHAGHDH